MKIIHKTMPYNISQVPNTTIGISTNHNIQAYLYYTKFMDLPTKDLQLQSLLQRFSPHISFLTISHNGSSSSSFPPHLSP